MADILSNDPLEQEYRAKIAAVSMALASFYQEAMKQIITLQEANKPQEDVYTALESLGEEWATKIVDDISPKKTIL